MDQSVRYTSIPCIAVPTKVKKCHNQYTEYNDYHQSIVTYTYTYILLHTSTTLTSNNLIFSNDCLQILMDTLVRYTWVSPFR